MYTTRVRFLLVEKNWIKLELLTLGERGSSVKIIDRTNEQTVKLPFFHVGYIAFTENATT